MADGKTSYLMVRILGDASDAVAAMGTAMVMVARMEDVFEDSTKGYNIWSEAFTSASSQVEMDMMRLSKSFKKHWKIIGGAALAGGAAIAVSSARAEQSLQALETVWGEQADEILAFTQTLSEYGISTQKAADATIFFGTMLQNLGFTLEESQKLTEQLITLSLDMAAVMGYSVPQAIQALSSAMRGEFEPIEKFGVTLNQAAVEAEMLEQELAGVTYASEQQAKVAAILGIIWEDTSAMHGAAAEEMNTLQGSTWNLIASVQNLITEVGLLANDELKGLVQALDGAVDKMGEMITEGGLLDAALDLTQTFVSDLATLLQPGLSQAIDWVDGAFEDLAGVINKTIIPAISGLMGWLDNLIGKMADTVEAAHDLGWELTEIFDHIVQSAPDLSALMLPPPTVAAPTPTVGVQATATSASSRGTVININTGVGDPHAIAKEIRRILKNDAVRMGRVA